MSDPDLPSFDQRCLDWIRDHDIGYVLDGQTLHQIGCPHVAGRIAEGFLDPYGVHRDPGELECFALTYFDEVSFCPTCDPPSQYFDLTTYRTWERIPDEPRRRLPNCRSRAGAQPHRSCL